MLRPSHSYPSCGHRHNNQRIRLWPYSYLCPGFVRIRAPTEYTTINTNNQHKQSPQTINTTINNKAVAAFVFVPQPYSYSCPGHIRMRAQLNTRQSTQQPENRAAAVFVFVSRPHCSGAAAIHTTHNTQQSINAAAAVFVFVTRSRSYSCMVLFGEVKHTTIK